MTEEEIQAQLQLFSNPEAVAQAADNVATRRISPNQGNVSPVREGLARGVEALIPFSNIRNDITMAGGTGQGDMSTVNRQALGFVTGATFGAPVMLGAIGEELGARIRGIDNQTLGERRQEIGALVRGESGLVGEIAGAVAGAPAAIGRGAIATVQRIPALARILAERSARGLAARTVGAATLSAAESGLYSLAVGNDLGDAGYDALFGAGAGALLQPATEGIMAIARSLSPRIGAQSERRAAESVVQLMRDAYGEEFTERFLGQNQLNIDAIERRLATSGQGDETMVELFPSALSSTVREIVNDPNIDNREAARTLISYMRRMQEIAIPQLRQGISAAIASPQVRSLEGLRQETMLQRQQLQPLYDEAFNNTVGPVSVQGLRTAITSAFGDAPLPAQQAVLNRLLRELPANRIRDPRTNRLIDNTLDPRTLLTLREQLDSVMFGGQFPSLGDNQAMSIDRNIVRNHLVPVREAISGALYSVAPDLQALDAQYSGLVRLEHAYEAGASVFRNTRGQNADLLDTFMNRPNRNADELAAFVEGIKFELMLSLGRTNSPTAIRNFMETNQARFQSVELALGPDVTNELLTSLDRYLLMRNVTQGVDTASPSGITGRRTSEGSGILADALIGTGALANRVSVAAGLGAARRQAAGLTNTGTGLQGEFRAFSDLLTQPADIAAQQVNRELVYNLPGLSRFLPGIAPLASDD